MISSVGSAVFWSRPETSRVRTPRSGAGFVLIIVVLALSMVQLISLGVLSLMFASLHGAGAHASAVGALNVAEGGLHLALAHLTRRAGGDDRGDERYPGEHGDISVLGPDGSVLGTFRVSVTCLNPAGAAPPACQTDPQAGGIDARDLRRITSEGFVPGRPGRARRHIEALVRRYRIDSADTPRFGVCGRESVIIEGEHILGDVGSNGDIRLGASARVRGAKITAPLVPPEVEPARMTLPGEGLTGVFSWRITFVDRSGEESSGSPRTALVVLKADAASLTDVPVGGVSIVERRIYRTLAGAASTGPWYYVATIPNNTARHYVDTTPDGSSRIPLPSPIRGTAVSAGTVTCAEDCQAQVSGGAPAGVRDIPCPNFLSPPCTPGAGPAPLFFQQTQLLETRRWSRLHLGSGERFTIVTPPDSRARLHIHIADLDLGPAAMVAIEGEGTVYFHVRGKVHLEDQASLGIAADALHLPGDLLLPAGRLQILSCVHDEAAGAGQPQTASVRFVKRNRVSALIFAPDAAIAIESPAGLSGLVFGRRVTMTRIPGEADGTLARGGSLTGVHNTGPSPIGPSGQLLRMAPFGPVALDPGEVIDATEAGLEPSPFQYLVKWYDNSNVQR